MENDLIERQQACKLIYDTLVERKDEFSQEYKLGMAYAGSLLLSNPPSIEAVSLPCKIGDEVWVNTGYHVVHARKVTVEEITISGNRILITGSYKQWLYEDYDQDGTLIKAENPPKDNKWWWESKTRCTWGKSAFATKAEAIAGKRRFGDE